MYVELSTGHCFIKESVKAITPSRPLPTYSHCHFEVVGVGYVVPIGIRLDELKGYEEFSKEHTWEELIDAVRQEFIDSLLN